MASQLTKRGYKYRSLPTNDTDTFGDFLNDDSEFNIKKLDADLEKLDDKVLLDGERKQNFNFIENKVVQDGLVEIQSDLEMRRVNTADTGLYKLYSNEALKDVNYFVVNIEELVEGALFFIFNSSDVILQVNKNNVGNNAKWLYVEIDKNSKKAKVNSDSGYTKEVNFENYRISFFGNYVGKYGAIGTCSAFMYYSCIISPKEILHNFSVLNNSESIKELRTTDSTGKTSILKLASSEDYVEMSTGRTLREEHMGVLKTLGKEFTSADGSSIEVNNGIEARVISGEIKGQTVKSIANVNDRFRTAIGDGTLKAVLTVQDIGLVKPSSDYTLVTEVISNTLNGHFKLVNINTLNMMMDTNDSVPAGKTGIFIVKLRSKANLSGASQIIRHALTTDSTSGSITYRSCVFEGDLTKVVKGFAPFGLVSTEAIISNNGQQYPIYEPTIQGKTRILNAQGVEVPAGTEGAMLVSLEPSDSSLPKLGSVPNVSDTVDRMSGILTENTKDMILNGSESGWGTSFEKENTLCFFIDIKDKYRSLQSIISNNFPTCKNGDHSTNDIEQINGLSSNSYIYIRILKSKLSTPDVNGFKQWLQANPTTIRYQLATPITTKLTAEQMKAYDAYKKVISLGSTPTKKDTLEIKDDGSAIYTQNTKDADDGSARIDLPAPIMTHIDKSLLPTIITQQTNTIEVGGAVKPSSFKVTLPTTDGIKKEYALTPINGWTGTAKANLLQTGDVGLVLDLTIPSSFNTLITNLPNELKPKTERTVLGYNGNTPVVVKIGTDGTIKLPISTTGTVKLDDTYKL